MQKRLFFLGYCYCLLVALQMNAQEEPIDAWLGHWINGVEYAKDPETYPKAIETYSTAIQGLSPNQINVLLNLVNEKGNIFIKMQDYKSAINDFSFVLNHPQASQEQKIEALWGRSKAYLASGKIDDYEKDYQRLQRLESYATPLEETKNYAILKMSPYFFNDPKSEERFIQMLIKNKKIKNKKDVTFTPSGVVIIQKANT